jgi:hypothetical protein
LAIGELKNLEIRELDVFKGEKVVPLLVSSFPRQVSSLHLFRNFLFPSSWALGCLGSEKRL